MFPLLFLKQRISSRSVVSPALNFITSHFSKIEIHNRQIKIPIFKKLLFNGDTDDGEQNNKSISRKKKCLKTSKYKYLINQGCSIFLLQETENWLLSVRWKILATPRLFESCQRSCGITQKTRPHCRRSKFQSDIYVPTKYWVDLSFNWRVIPDFFLFWNCKVQDHL